MKRLIGKFLLGHETINLFIDTQSGAATAHTPGWYGDGEKNDVGYLVIGINHERWPDALDGLLHEAEEYLMAKRLHRFEPDLGISDDSSACLFVMTHVQFQDMITTTATFLGDCEAAVKTAWEIERGCRAKRKGKKKKRQ